MLQPFAGVHLTAYSILYVRLISLPAAYPLPPATASIVVGPGLTIIGVVHAAQPCAYRLK